MSQEKSYLVTRNRIVSKSEIEAIRRKKEFWCSFGEKAAIASTGIIAVSALAIAAGIIKENGKYIVEGILLLPTSIKFSAYLFEKNRDSKEKYEIRFGNESNHQEDGRKR